jgi:pimeloyl-ACP methyl ester carboxylesterase
VRKVLLFSALMLGGFVMFVMQFVSQQERLAEKTYPPQGQFIDVDGTRIHAVVMGSGPDLVLIHGSSGSTRDMTFSLAPQLAENFRVIVFDRPGLGWSERIGENGASLTQQAEILMKAAQTLGADKPIVMGHSYGGGVALAWAVNFPQSLSALVTVSSVGNVWTTPLDTLYKVTSSPMGSLFIVPLLTAFVPDEKVRTSLRGVFAPQAIPEGYMRYIGAGLTLRRATLRENARQRANLLDDIKGLYQRYGEITVPTEIVHGTADDTVNLELHAEYLAREIPDAVLTRLDGIGHMPHQVATSDVIAAITRAATRAGLR